MQKPEQNSVDIPLEERVFTYDRFAKTLRKRFCAKQDSFLISRVYNVIGQLDINVGLGVSSSVTAIGKTNPNNNHNQQQNNRNGTNANASGNNAMSKCNNFESYMTMKSTSDLLNGFHSLNTTESIAAAFGNNTTRSSQIGPDSLKELNPDMNASVPTGGGAIGGIPTRINWAKFRLFLSILLHGSFVFKLYLCFLIYDTDHDGYITYHDIFTLLKHNVEQVLPLTMNKLLQWVGDSLAQAKFEREKLLEQQQYHR